MKKTLIPIFAIAVIAVAVSFAGLASANAATVKFDLGAGGEGNGGDNVTNAAASTTAKRATKLDQSQTRLQTRAGNEIDRRIAALNRLQERIQGMKKISAAAKNSFVANVQAQINLLNNLRIKINAEDTDGTTLKDDVQSITKAYRIYALILPQIEIVAAADRLASTADSLSTYAVKLQARAVVALSEGKNVTTLQALLTDMNAKISDAKDRSAKAIAGVINLTPDNGDKTTQSVNLAALKAARTDLRTGTQDLKDAHKIGLKIREGLKNFAKADAKANATSTATTTSE